MFGPHTAEMKIHCPRPRSCQPFELELRGSIDTRPTLGSQPMCLDQRAFRFEEFDERSSHLIDGAKAMHHQSPKFLLCESVRDHVWIDTHSVSFRSVRLRNKVEEYCFFFHQSLRVSRCNEVDRTDRLPYGSEFDQLFGYISSDGAVRECNDNAIWTVFGHCQNGYSFTHTGNLTVAATHCLFRIAHRKGLSRRNQRALGAAWIEVVSNLRNLVV